jgi:selenoprotein W-related protein
MAAAIKKEFKVKPALIKGSGGVFEVTADDRLIFSKRATGRFPEEEEILELLRDGYET